MLNRIRKSLQSRLQYWLGIPLLFVELDKLAKRVTSLENKTRQGRRPVSLRTRGARTRGPQRHDEIERDRKRQRKGE